MPSVAEFGAFFDRLHQSEEAGQDGWMAYIARVETRIARLESETGHNKIGDLRSAAWLGQRPATTGLTGHNRLDRPQQAWIVLSRRDD